MSIGLYFNTHMLPRALYGRSYTLKAVKQIFLVSEPAHHI